MRAFALDAMPGRIVFGVDRVAVLPDEADRLGVERVLVIAAPSGKRFADDIADRLGSRYVGIFADVQQHVPIGAVRAALIAAETSRADCVITIGGGSATGFGKAVALETGIPTIAVPTTYAGSEVTPIYGITSEGSKRTGRDVRVLPRTVVYDPVLTVTLPPSVTGPSGMNAIAHCMEALYAEAGNPITSIVAEEGIRALVQGIPRAVRDPNDLDARSDALYGSYLAGSALAVVGMAIHHRICHVLGGTFGLAHADANAVILPHAAAFNEAAAPEAIATVGRALGTADAPSGLFDLLVDVAAPTSLAELGMREADLDEAARLVVDHPPWNPRPVDERNVRTLLDDAFHGRRPGRTGVSKGGG